MSDALTATMSPAFVPVRARSFKVPLIFAGALLLAAIFSAVVLGFAPTDASDPLMLVVGP